MICLPVSVSAGNDLEIKNAWVRLPPPGAGAAAGYLTIHNSCDDDYYVTAVTSPVFGSAELHESVEQDGIATMQHHKFYTVPANSVFEAKPGSYHLMLFRWKNPLQEGDVIPFELQLGNGNRIGFNAIVKRQ